MDSVVAQESVICTLRSERDLYKSSLSAVKEELRVVLERREGLDEVAAIVRDFKGEGGGQGEGHEAEQMKGGTQDLSIHLERNYNPRGGGFHSPGGNI